MTKKKITEREMLDLLHQRYGFVSAGARRYAVAEHVPNQTIWAGSIADFIAIDCWKGRKVYPAHGFEIKCSRSDWLRELKQPEKAEAWKSKVNYWWLVISDRDICKRNELPIGWGLLVKTGNQLRQVTEAPHRKVDPMDWATQVAVMRAIQKTARKRGEGDRVPA